MTILDRNRHCNRGDSIPADIGAIDTLPACATSEGAFSRLFGEDEFTELRGVFSAADTAGPFEPAAQVVAVIVIHGEGEG